MEGQIRQSVVESKVSALLQSGRLKADEAWALLLRSARDGSVSQAEFLTVAGSLGQAERGEGRLWTPR